MRKYLIKKMMDVLAEKYEHLDIMEIYLNDAGQKCIRYLAHTYSSDGGYDFNAEWNEDYNYRIVYHSHQAEVLLSDFISGMSDYLATQIDGKENEISIEDTMLEDDRQYIQDCTSEGFAETLSEYVYQNNVYVLAQKEELLDENIPVGKYMFLLDLLTIDTFTFISEMVNKLDLEPSKKDEYVSKLLVKIN